MKRVGSVLLVVLLICQALTLPVMAADGDGGSFWDVIDGIGGFFSDLFNTIFDAVEALITGIIDLLKYLFIPHQNYFDKMLTRINTKLSEKFGGALSSMRYLQDRFSKMKAHPGLSNSFKLEFPRGHLLGGISLDLSKYATGVFPMIRAAFSGFIVLLTAAFCYRKVTALLTT